MKLIPFVWNLSVGWVSALLAINHVKSWSSSPEKGRIRLPSRHNTDNGIACVIGNRRAEDDRAKRQKSRIEEELTAGRGRSRRTVDVMSAVEGQGFYQSVTSIFYLLHHTLRSLTLSKGPSPALLGSLMKNFATFCRVSWAISMIVP